MSTILKTVLVVALGMSGIALTACASTEAHPSALTGDQGQERHERHATGIDSEVKDK